MATGEESTELDVRCVPCAVTGITGSAPFCSLRVNDFLCVGGDTQIGGNVQVCGTVSAVGGFSGPGTLNSAFPIFLTNTGNVTGCTGTAGAFNIAGGQSIAGNLAVGGNIEACGYINTNDHYRLNSVPVVRADVAPDNLSVGQNTPDPSIFGFDSTFIGQSAGELATGGTFLTAVGAHSLRHNTTGRDNVALGDSALEANTTGSNNTAAGWALYINTTGSNNTAIGSQALNANTIGNNNIALGFSAGLALTAGDNNIYIGNNGEASESGTIRIGTLGTHTDTYIQGINGATIAGAGATVLVDAVGKLGTVPSSSRFKDDIQNLPDQSERVMQLRPVDFVFKNDPAAARHLGLIAEEVAQVYPNMIIYDRDGQVYSIQYMHLIPILLQQVQQLKEENKEQTEAIKRLYALVTTVQEPQNQN